MRNSQCTWAKGKIYLPKKEFSMQDTLCPCTKMVKSLVRILIGRRSSAKYFIMCFTNVFPKKLRDYIVINCMVWYDTKLGWEYWEGNELSNLRCRNLYFLRWHFVFEAPKTSSPDPLRQQWLVLNGCSCEFFWNILLQAKICCQPIFTHVTSWLC